MSAIFESILHMSAVGSIVIFTVVIVRFFLKNAPKVYSYLLWAIVLLRLLCPFTLQSPLSTIPENLTFDEAIEKLSEPRTQSYIEAEPVIQPNPGEIGNMELDEIYWPDIETGYENVPDGSIPSAPAEKTDWPHVLSVVWICGVCVMAVWSLVVYIRLKIRLREATVFDNGVYLTDKVGSPFVLGIFRPRIYLPASLSSEEWEYIVLHERCHIRRGDHITRVLAFAALALHWFNPLVWLAFILSGKDMEMSCDEAVLRSMGPEVRKAYCTSLLSLSTGRPILSGMPLAFGEGDTKSRIKNLAKWRKPTIAMIIAAVIVCIVAAVCLLTDPIEREAQIRVNGRVYTYTGGEEFPVGPIWEIGMLEGIVHRSGEEPEKDFYGTNLDEKYAGQPIYACLDGRLYLFIFDEWGHFLPFELPKGDIVSGPTEVARGDFNRDGQSDFITVTEYSNSVEIILADSISAKTLWADTASLVEGQQKCFIARKDEDGDSIIRYTFQEEGYCNYIRFFIGENGELDVEKGRSPIDHLLEASFTDPEAISASLPENSTFLFSTYGGEVVIGPINSGSNISEEESFCKAAFRELANSEALHYTYEIHINGELRTDLPCNEGWFFGEDWLLISTADMPGAMRSQTIAEVDGVQYVVSGLGDEQTSPSCFYAGEFDAYGKKPIEDFINYDLEFISESDTDDGKVYSFTVLTDGVGTDNLQSYIFDKSGRLTEAHFESGTIEAVLDGVPQFVSQTVVYRFPEVSAEECREAIDKAFYSIAARSEAELNEKTVYDDGSDVIAVPYGESVVIDLDGDGADEVLCMKASNIYGIWSLTVNGIEYLESLEMYIGDSDNLNPCTDQLPDYYIVRTYEGDYSPKICVYDDGPSGDPNTHFFTFNGSLQYHGSIPCHMSRLSLDGNHHLTGPARLSVFQTWYAEHTWLLPNNGSKVSEVERDFYYVDDFEFIFWEQPYTAKYSPLLCQVYAYRERDISAQPFVLEKGTQLSILGTDDKEWLLVADKAGREYYLHLCGINSYSVDTPAGEIMGNEVFAGLSYAD